MQFNLLKLNLTKQKSIIENLSPSSVEKFIGGRGLAASLLVENVHDPLTPENPIYIMTGTVSGCFLPCASRISVNSISPLTGFYLSSNAGGFFSSRLRSQGIFGIEIVGKAPKPTYITIFDSSVEFHDAKELWEKNTYEVMDFLNKDKKTSVAMIGQAGENLVKFASIQFDLRSAGRSGGGTLFGYKNLKAIAVNQGDFVKPNDRVKELSKSLLNEIMEAKKSLKEFGTPGAVTFSNSVETFPTENFRNNKSENAYMIDEKAVKQKTIKSNACFNCSIACSKVTKSKNGTIVEGPEYETLWSLGADCENYDLDIIIESNKLCDLYGLDTISIGATIAWFRECCQKGLVKDKWIGNEMILDLIEKIAFRKGIGDLLAEGSFKASKKIKGSENFLAGAKGLEAPAWDPRACWAMALNYATSPTGADHRKGHSIREDLKSKKRDSINGKAEIAIKRQNWYAVIDSSGFCGFIEDILTYEKLAKIFTAITGLEFTIVKVKSTGARIIDTERQINLKRGLTKKDDTLSPRILDYTVTVENRKTRIGKENLEKMKKEYYRLRGW